MKKILFLFLLVSGIAQAQHTVKGTMIPPNNTDWVILYKIEGAKQRFIANTNTKVDTATINGKKTPVAKFEFTLPENAKTGVYRVTYRQDANGFVNFIFNKENIVFSFNPDFPEQSIIFSESKENQIFNEFLQANILTQKKLDSLQVSYLKTPSKAIEKKYPKALKKIIDVYSIYEDKTEGMLANHYIKALQQDNVPKVATNPQSYFNSVLDNFFNNINFNNKELYNSPILIDKISDYIFYLNYSAEPQLQQKLFKEAIATVMNKITDARFKKETSEYLIEQFTKKQNAEIVDVIFENYYNKLPVELQNERFRNKNLGKLQAAIGRIAPDFSWKENGITQKLSTLKDGKNYLLLFWSTSCSHCLKEIPKVYEFMKSQPNTKVIAYALEKEDFEWNEFVKKLQGWHNVIGLNPKNKWNNKLVTDTYQVHATPSYFVLDVNKKIIAKPHDLEVITKYYTKK